LKKVIGEILRRVALQGSDRDHSDLRLGLLIHFRTQPSKALRRRRVEDAGEVVDESLNVQLLPLLGMGRRNGAKGEQQEEAGMRCNESEPASHYINSTRKRPALHLTHRPLESRWSDYFEGSADLHGLCKNPFRCHPEGSEGSRSGLHSGHCEFPRRLRLLGMTGEEGHSVAVKAAAASQTRTSPRAALTDSGVDGTIKDCAWAAVAWPS